MIWSDSWLGLWYIVVVRGSLQVSVLAIGSLIRWSWRLRYVCGGAPLGGSKVTNVFAAGKCLISVQWHVYDCQWKWILPVCACGTGLWRMVKKKTWVVCDHHCSCSGFHVVSPVHLHMQRQSATLSEPGCKSLLYCSCPQSPSTEVTEKRNGALGGPAEVPSLFSSPLSHFPFLLILLCGFLWTASASS